MNKLAALMERVWLLALIVGIPVLLFYGLRWENWQTILWLLFIASVILSLVAVWVGAVKEFFTNAITRK